MRASSLRLAIALLLVLCTVSQPCALRAEDPGDAYYVHAPVPLGVEAIKLEQDKKLVYLLASVENQTLDGLYVKRVPHQGRVQRVDGSLVLSYPDALDFRVTATAMPNEFQGIDTYSIKNQQPLNDFLLGLKFRLKIFRGLKMVELTPANVRMIGVPAYQRYDERVYRVTFDTPDVPMDARMVLEVFSADGQRLTRFHLEML